jgi:hypothetical protein
VTVDPVELLVIALGLVAAVMLLAGAWGRRR